MVQIIEDETKAGGVENRIEFGVWRTPTGDIRGRWQDAREEPGRLASIIGSEPFTPIEDEFRRVVDWARACGVPFVWVNDPKGLFPPSARPAV